MVTLSGRRRDVELLAAESVDERPSVDAHTSGRLLLELHDPDGDATGDDAARAAKVVIDAFVRRLNGVGKLRWGRAFTGVSVAAIKSYDSAGSATVHAFVEPAVEHMLPEAYAAMVERLGHARPAPPAGVDVVEALDLPAVISLAEAKPEVSDALELVSLLLEGDDEIDWVAGYVALEMIEHDLAGRQTSGQALGWWTAAERKRFRATANSPEVLGVRARHGKPFGLQRALMSSSEANRFVRRAVAHWLTHLLEA